MMNAYEEFWIGLSTKQIPVLSKCVLEFLELKILFTLEREELY